MPEKQRSDRELHLCLFAFVGDLSWVFRATSVTATLIAQLPPVRSFLELERDAPGPLVSHQCASPAV